MGTDLRRSRALDSPKTSALLSLIARSCRKKSPEAQDRVYACFALDCRNLLELRTALDSLLWRATLLLSQFASSALRVGLLHIAREVTGDASIVNWTFGAPVDIVSASVSRLGISAKNLCLDVFSR